MNHFSKFELEDFRTLIIQLPEPVCIFSSFNDRPDLLIYANEKCRELLQSGTKEIIGTSWENLCEAAVDAETDVTSLTEPDRLYKTTFKKRLNGRVCLLKMKEFTAASGARYFMMTISDETEHDRTKEDLRVSVSEFESLFKYNPHIVYMIDENGYFKNFNPAGLERLKYAYSELEGKFFLDVVTGHDRERTKDHFFEVLKGRVQHFQIQIQDKYNTLLTVEVTAVPIFVDGKVQGVIGTAQDITLCLETELKLTESEESHRAIFDHNVDPVITFDLEGNFITFNEATKMILGMSPEELKGESFLGFINEEVREETKHNFQQVLKGKPYQYETSTRNKEGEMVWLHITLIPAFLNDELSHIHCIGKDITLNKKHQAMMHQMAYHDSLTGLGNQQLFSRDLYRMLNETTDGEFSLCIIGLDRFKFINDYFGREAGDHILSIIAERLKKSAGDRGAVYRYGGDEFAILTANTTVQETRRLAEEAIANVRESFDDEGYETVLTASVGVSFYPRHGVNKKEIVRAADRAMYFAKKHGRNIVQLYSSNIEGLTESNVKMETLMRRALKNKEFIVYYQPQFKADTEEICGIEALLRWHNDELGWVSPATFIPLAEETGLIVPIGNWILEEACRQNVSWQKNGFPTVPISVNLSLRQFYQSDLCEMVESVILMTGIQPELLTLEITETIAMQEGIASGILNTLKQLGVKIAMDDFGTGYSSLQYLQSFSIDHVKIDKAFTDKLDTKEGRAIISTIIALGHNLGMKVVAEGVETAEQVQSLRQLGCDIFQGYYFSRPLPPMDLADISFQHQSSK